MSSDRGGRIKTRWVARLVRFLQTAYSFVSISSGEEEYFLLNSVFLNNKKIDLNKNVHVELNLRLLYLDNKVMKNRKNIFAQNVYVCIKQELQILLMLD